MRVRWMSVIGTLVVAMMILSGCAPAAEPVEPAATPENPTATAEGQSPAPPEPTADPYPGWTTYTNAAFGVSFRYPSTWFGPDVYEFEDGVRLEVGSDEVYPYGTGPEDRQPGAPNAYSIVIQYTLNSSRWTLEQYRAEQPWLADMLAVLDLQDGGSITTTRSLTTRLRALAIGRFTGVEYTTTLSDTAQTERLYMRTAFLMDENLNVIVISGQPVNVEITDAATWRATFAALDAANEPAFRSLVESIQVE